MKKDCQTRAHNFAAGWIRFWFPWVRLWEADSVSDPSWDLFAKGRDEGTKEKN